MTSIYKIVHASVCLFVHVYKKLCERIYLSIGSQADKKILEEIKDGRMFGMAEVDIETPDSLKGIFAEFQPIQKHAYLSRDDIGEHMKKFAQENGLLKKPSKTLLNSYFAQKILLSTPLLQWYINHGLKVTKLYQVIQFKLSKCFHKFGEEVMLARREGDVDPSKKIISDSSKLIGKHHA